MANEERLIDTNMLVVPKFDMKGRDLFNQGYCQGKTDGILEVKALAPTVDAVKVVHGRWEQLGEADYKCSECGFRFTSGDPISMFLFCRCGAKMDGGISG